MTSAHPLCNHDQSNALLHFKKTIQYGTSGCQWYTGGANLDSWKEGSDCCSWEGLSCNEVSGDVLELDLSCSGINGSIRSNSTLFHLPHLQSLNLAYNYIPVFQIPSNFGKELKYLNLSSCLSSDFVPVVVGGNLSNLETLEISAIWDEYSNLDMQVQNLTKLRILILGNVNLNWNHLEEIKNLTKLIHLDLSYCRSTGELASVSFSNLEELEHLNLDYNHFSGGFPISLANLSKLNYLSLTYNNLNGHIPFITNGFQAISTMILSGNSFGGPIPSWLFNRSSLQDLDISNNLLVGALPSNNVTLHHNQLMHLDLSDNGLTDTIPSTLFASPSLESFLLPGNNLTGYVGEFQSLMLQEIDLSSNSLKGGNFSSISKLVNLKRLDLSSNNLTGTFELDLFSSLENLEFVSLSENIFLSPNSRNDTAYFPLPKLEFLEMENCNANEIPFFIRNLIGVQTLSKNKIHGLLPEWLRNTSMGLVLLSDNSITGGLQNLPLDCTVDLSNNKLRTLPSNFSASFLDLSHNLLESGVENIPSIHADELNLSFNNLKGELKGNISISILDLSHNSLTGAENIQGFGLYSLDLSFNNLQGTLPIPSVDKKISVYLVSNNQLSGNIHPDMCEMGLLELINLSYNNLSGKIPDCFLKIPSLLLVNLRSNNFSGIIPQTIGKSLVVLDMSSNQLQGIIPRSLANCQDLMFLDLSNNLIYDTFPTWLEDKQRLDVLVLRSNRLHGNLSSAKSKVMNISSTFSHLRMIDVSNNKLFGVLPSHYFESWTSMMKYDNGNGDMRFDYGTRGYDSVNPVTIVNKGMEMEFGKQLIKVVDFSNNMLEGVIPESIGNLSFLMALNLSSNHFSGEIPSSLGKLVQLNSLDLSNNNLSGRIPGTLSSLTFLGAFNVSNNNLEGPIPQGGQLTTFLNDSFKGNPNLCGIQLETKCRAQLVPHSPPVFGAPEEDDESWLDGVTWESVAIGYGCGFTLGIIGGVLILKRYQEFVLGIFNIRVLWRIRRTPQR